MLITQIIRLQHRTTLIHNTNINQSTSDSNVTTDNRNVNENNSRSDNTNRNINESNSTQTINQNVKSEAPPASAIAPSIMSYSQDLCTTGVSGAFQGQVFGLSGGKTIADENCERLKLSKYLYDMGMKVASVAFFVKTKEYLRLCQWRVLLVRITVKLVKKPLWLGKKTNKKDLIKMTLKKNILLNVHMKLTPTETRLIKML